MTKPQPAVAAVGAERPRRPRPSPRPRPLPRSRPNLRHRKARRAPRLTSARSRRGGSSAIRQPAIACSPNASRPLARCSTGPRTRGTRSSSSRPTTATRRGWSGSCSGRATSSSSGSFSSSRWTNAGAVSPARHVRRISHPRPGRGGRKAPSAAVSGSLPDRAAQFWRAAQSNLNGRIENPCVTGAYTTFLRQYFMVCCRPRGVLTMTLGRLGAAALLAAFAAGCGQTPPKPAATHSGPRSARRRPHPSAGADLADPAQAQTGSKARNV